MAFNSSLFYLDKFAQRAAQNVSTNAKVLDAGSGEGPYQKYFSHTHYESLDFCRVNKTYQIPTYVSSLEKIPSPDNAYDLVLLTQVLEHVSHPLKVLKEINRVLKADGRLWLSAPFYYPEHEIPYDYFRYTQFGLKHLLQESGFECRELEWLEGYFGTLGLQWELAGRNLPVNPKRLPFFPWNLPLSAGLWLIRMNCRWLAKFFYRLDQAKKIIHTGHPKNYTVVAVKRRTTHSPLPGAN